jgi:hypothetical protein
MAGVTRAGGRARRQPVPAPACALLVLLLAVLTPQASPSMAIVDHAALAGRVRPAVERHAAGRPSLAGGPRENPGRPGDCAPDRGVRHHRSCCESPGQDGVTTTSPETAPRTVRDAIEWSPAPVSLPGCPDTAESGPGPPDLHMLQLLRI